MSKLKNTLLAGLAAVTICLPATQSSATQPGQLQTGKFLMCDSAGQIAEYLTMTEAEGINGVEAQEASGTNPEGHKVCGIGHWVYRFVGEHSRFQVGDNQYAINEILVVGYVVNGIGQQSKPVRQFGFGLVGKKQKPKGFAI